MGESYDYGELQMNTRLTFVVVIIAVLLCAYFIFVESNGENESAMVRDEDNNVKAGRLLLGDELVPGQVKQVCIKRGGEKEVVIERCEDGDGEWVQREPIEFLMQDAMVDDLVNTICGLRYTGSVGGMNDDEELKRIGLGPGCVVVCIGIKAGDNGELVKHRLRLGRVTAGRREYLQLDDEKEIYVVGDELHELLDRRSARTMRRRGLPCIEAGQVRRILVERDDEKIELERRDDEWWLLSPCIGLADRGAAEELARVISACYIMEFVDDEPEDLSVYGFDKPLATLTIEVVNVDDLVADLESKKGELKSHKLVIGGVRDLDAGEIAYFAMWDDVDTVFVIGIETINVLNMPISQLESATLEDASK